MTDIPSYDPAVHTAESDEVARLEMWCACGLAHRQVDPAAHLQTAVATFRARHDGTGHGPVTAKKAMAEREERRKAWLRSQGRGEEYEPREHAEVSGSAGFDWTKGMK